jgi:hypothetical protein
MAQSGSNRAASRNAHNASKSQKPVQQRETLVKPNLRLRRRSRNREMAVSHASNHYWRRESLDGPFFGLAMHVDYLRDAGGVGNGKRNGGPQAPQAAILSDPFLPRSKGPTSEDLLQSLTWNYEYLQHHARYTVFTAARSIVIQKILNTLQ